jgi:hypothetical protein
MGEDLVEKAFLRVAALDNLAVVAAVHRGVVSGKIEAGLVLVGVVAVEATVLEEGADGLLVGNVGPEGGGEEGEENPKSEIRKGRIADLVGYDWDPESG